MSATPPYPATASLDAETHAQIVGELIDAVTTVVNAQLDGYTTRLADALQKAAERSADGDIGRMKQQAAAAVLLRKNRYPFSYVMAERTRAALQNEMQAAAKGLSKAGEASGALKSLSPDIEIDKMLSLRKVGREIEAQHAERLAALGVRLAYLFGREELAPAQHPCRPEVFLSAIHEAWCEFHPDTAAHSLLFPLLNVDMCLDMSAILHAANVGLVKRGILPQLGAVTVPSRTRRASADASGDALTQRLHALLGAPENTAAASPAGAFPALMDEQALRGIGGNSLLDYLDTLQKNLFDQHLAACAGTDMRSATVLEHIQRHAPAGSIGTRDQQVIELLGAVFNAMLSEPSLAPEMKTMIASLQLPMLKAALNDRAFFFRPEQPARRTVELLAEVAAGCDASKGQTDPVYQAVKRNVERIQRGAAELPAVFTDAIWDLESFIRREQTAADHVLASPIAQALRDEKTREAERAARHEVALRIGTGEVVAFVETFLEDKWVPVLTLAYSVQDEKPKAVPNALKTMDDLVWSVKPKISQSERKELLGMLPALIASLNKWLDLVKWSDTERQRFFAELAACHASLVRAPLEMSAQRQLELALNVAKQAAERRLQRKALEVPLPEPDEFDRRVRRLESGAWLEFAVPNGKRRLRLAWISPMRSLYLFATRDRQQALSLSNEALAAALRDQRAQIIEPGGLVRRALCSALGILAANSGDPASNDGVQSVA